MAVDVKDLPPAYQVQALRKWEEQERRRKRPTLPCPDSGGPEKKTKYHNVPAKRVTDSGAILRFDSQKEARRYDELAALERAGTIRELRMQVDFTLQEAYTDGEGRRARAIRYRADFSYKKRPKYWTGYESQCPDDGWILVVEDVKSRATRTKEYIMKRKLMKERFGVEIREV
jgi:hypothetical protein